MAKSIRGKNEGSISKRPNGHWRAQVSLEGKRLSFSAKTQKECQTWLRNMLEQKTAGMTFDDAKVTMAEYMEDWLASSKASHRFTTWDQYRRMTHNNILPGIGKIKLSELRPSQIQHLYDTLLSQNIGHYALLKTHTVLRSALSRAVKIGMIPRNTASVVMLPKEPAKEMQILDESQVNRFLVAASGHRFEALYHLAVVTGMRVMELLGLKWTDLDWIRQTLKVERQILRPHGQGIEFASPKTKFGKRTLKLGSKTIDALRQHDWLQQKERIAAGDKWQNLDLIFTNHLGGPLLYRNLFRDYKALLEEAGLPLIRFHDLRHTAASIMLNHNVPVITVSRRLGHSKPSITLDIYGHLMANAQTDVAEMMDDLISPIELHPTAPQLHQNAANKL